MNEINIGFRFLLFTGGSLCTFRGHFLKFPPVQNRIYLGSTFINRCASVADIPVFSVSRHVYLNLNSDAGSKFKNKSVKNRKERVEQTRDYEFYPQQYQYHPPKTFNAFYINVFFYFGRPLTG